MKASSTLPFSPGLAGLLGAIPEGFGPTPPRPAPLPKLPRHRGRRHYPSVPPRHRGKGLIRT